MPTRHCLESRFAEYEKEDAKVGDRAIAVPSLEPAGTKVRRESSLQWNSNYKFYTNFFITNITRASRDPREGRVTRWKWIRLQKVQKRTKLKNNLSNKMTDEHRRSLSSAMESTRCRWWAERMATANWLDQKATVKILLELLVEILEKILL